MNNYANNYLESLDEVFSGASPSQEKVLGLMDETMEFFRQIKMKLTSEDPLKQKEAFEETMEMKRIIESKMQTLSEKTGLDMAQLAALAENTNGMSQEERGTLIAAQAKFQQIKSEN